MTFEIVEQISLLDPDSDEQLKTLHDIYLGLECETFLLKEPQECTIEMRQNCLEFYKTAVHEIIKHLPYDTFFEQLNFWILKLLFLLRLEPLSKILLLLRA